MSPAASHQIEIRIARQSDLVSLLNLFRNCVLTICRAHYSQDELTAWASACDNVQSWKNKIETQYFVVAHINEVLVGFGSLENNDLIDLLYVHKDCQGMGVASKIFESLSSMAGSQGIHTLKAEVSKTARLFFEAKGFVVARAQSKQMAGTLIENYQMIKDL